MLKIKLVVKYIYSFVFFLLLKILSFLRVGRTKIQGARIILFHSVPEKSLPAFEKKIAYLSKNYNIISLSEFVDGINRQKDICPNTLVITFDDGYKDNFLNAVPILKKYNVPSLFFITTRFIDLSGTRELCSFHRDAYPGKSDFTESMTWADIGDLVKLGFEIGSHTVSHKRLSLLNEKDLLEEIKRSKHIIEKRINCEVKHFSFPFGAKKDAPINIGQLAQSAGYHSCSSGVRGKNTVNTKPYFLFRDNIDPGWPIFMMETIIRGAFDR